MRYRLSLLLFLGPCFSCGGITVVDEPVGAGGSSSSGNSSSGSGSTGSGSTGSGSTGSGSTGSGMPDCDGIASAYQDALEEAKGCDSDIDFVQCTERANNALRCPCSTMVNPENKDAIAKLEELQSQWSAAACDEDLNCPAVECPEVGDTSCSPNLNGGGQGLCVSEGDG